MKEFLHKKRFSKSIFIYILVILSISSLLMGSTAILQLGIYIGVGRGNSMASTMTDGTKLLLMSSDKRGINRGDMVSILAYDYGNYNKESLLVKRVIAMPGETIIIKRNKVYIDGNLLEEPYASYSDISYDDFKVKVPKDTYFVMGDNRLQSSDSRTFGVVPMENIFGVVIKIKK